MNKSPAIFATCFLVAIGMGVLLRPNAHSLHRDVPELINATGPELSHWEKTIATMTIERLLLSGTQKRLVSKAMFWSPPEEPPPVGPSVGAVGAEVYK